jgi:ParB family transcriptional regulator, chromosome partitioning protein
MQKSVLGRGLSALIDTDNVSTSGSSSINEIDIAKIHANPNQPRTHFDEEALSELAASIKEIGIIQPITLRKISEDNYQIIAGERRYRASKMVGMKKIPAYVKTAQDEHVMAMALIENIQREDLNSIEIALTYFKLLDEYKLTQEQLSEKVGKKRATVANYLRLLKLPAEIQMGITAKKIDMGHARALVNMQDAALQLKLYHQILVNDYPVRKVEELVRQLNEVPEGETEKQVVQKNVKQLAHEYEVLKAQLSRSLNAKVLLVRENNGKGKITIPFTSDEELERIMTIFDKLQN